MQEGWLKQGMLKEFSSEKFLESGSSEAYKEDGRKTLRWISRRWTARMEGNWLKIVIKWSVMLEVLNFPIILPVIFSCTNTNDWLTDWLWELQNKGGKTYSPGLHIFSTWVICDFSYLIGLDFHLLQIQTNFYKAIHAIDIIEKSQNIFTLIYLKTEKCLKWKL